MKQLFKSILFVTFLFVASMTAAIADEISLNQPKAIVVHKDSPRQFFSNLLSMIQNDEYNKIVDQFDFRSFSEKDKQNIGLSRSRKFANIIKQKFYYGVETISPRSLGNQQDGLPFYREKIVSIDGKTKPFVVYIDRIKAASGSRWLISPLTHRDIDRFYSELEDVPVDQRLPKIFRKHIYGTVSLYHIVLIFLLGVASIICTYVMNLPVIIVSKFGTNKRKNPKRAQLLKYFTKPVNFIFFITVWLFLLKSVQLPKELSNYVIQSYKTLGLLSVAWLISCFVDFFSSSIELSVGKAKSKLKTRTSIIGGKSGLKVLIFFIFFLVLLQSWGVNVTAVFASLGVGGIAIALAGQKTFENLFGGIMLAVDKPVRVGDFCKFGDQLGTIEEIGPRSTKIRSLDRTLVVVPNGDFSQMKIENYDRRDCVRLHKIFGFTYDTTSDQMRYLIVEIKKILLAHPMVEEHPCRVRWIDYNNYSLDIEVHAHVSTKDWSEFLAVREDIFLKIMDLVKESGCKFAFPSQTLYMTQEEVVERKLVERVEKQVREWKDSSELDIPDFSDEHIQQVLNSEAWPPVSSVKSKS